MRSRSLTAVFGSTASRGLPGKNYRAALDLVLIPRFGTMRLTAITLSTSPD
jgi:hypothetical protein